MVARTSASKKAKGSKLEHEIAKRIEEVLGNYGVYARRMPLSGSVDGFEGDIYTNLPVSFEAKNQEKIQLWACWRQAVEQASSGKIPVLVISKNFLKEPVAVLSLEDLLFFFELAIQSGWIGNKRNARKAIK